MEEGVRGILSLFHNCMNFKYTVIRSSSAFTAGTGTITIILDLQGWLTVKRQAAFAPLLTHAGQMAKYAGFGNTLSLCVCVSVYFSLNISANSCFIPEYIEIILKYI